VLNREEPRPRHVQAELNTVLAAIAANSDCIQINRHPVRWPQIEESRLEPVIEAYNRQEIAAPERVSRHGFLMRSEEAERRLSRPDGRIGKAEVECARPNLIRPDTQTVLVHHPQDELGESMTRWPRTHDRTEQVSCRRVVAAHKRRNPGDRGLRRRGVVRAARSGPKG
jgi:hypothetical protein